MKKSGILVLMAAALMLVACDLLQKNGGGSSASVSVTLKNATGDCDKGSVFVVANCISQWELELDFGENDPWATLSHTSGTGYKSNILLSYEENTTGESRSLSIILTSGNKKSETVFTQNSTQQEKHDYGADVTDCGWLELPETKADDGLEWFCHHFNHNGKSKRNYSFYYSYDDYVSLWVAYPLNASLIGSGSRSDAWEYDPLIPKDLQINIVDGGIPGYDRGHQLPSADRYSGNSNPQTFYSTNMTPQRGKFNQNIWAGVEDKVRSWAKDGKADTLYVVTGCTVKGSTKKATDRSGHSVTVPTSYWKACLKCTTSGWTACGIWLDHYTSATSITRNDLFSIDELENKIGIDLFVNLPAKIGDSQAALVESTKPTELAWPL
ncbi:MAG: DNA/RNA non-specific endonuclease [Candidatus Cryptobacteroides sp.]|nr:DNA/RNA non-specific endonuclease [Candidatus Cryptobacteroides sp.]